MSELAAPHPLRRTDGLRRCIEMQSRLARGRDEQRLLPVAPTAVMGIPLRGWGSALPHAEWDHGCHSPPLTRAVSAPNRGSPPLGDVPNPSLRGSAARDDARHPCQLCGAAGDGERSWDFPAVPSGVLQAAKRGASQSVCWPRAPCAAQGVAPRGTAVLGAEPICASRSHLSPRAASQPVPASPARPIGAVRCPAGGN